MNDLTQFAQDMLQIAKTSLQDDDSLMPVVFAYWMDPNKPAMVIGLQFGNSQEKRLAYRVIEQFVSEQKPDALVMINDAWIKTTHPGDTAAIERMDRNGVVNEPDRKEAIMVFISPRDGDDRTLMQPYHRDGGKIVWEEPRMDSFDGVNKLLSPFWKNRATAEQARAN